MFTPVEEAVRRGRRIPPSLDDGSGRSGTDRRGSLTPATHLPQRQKGPGVGWEVRSKNHQGRSDLRVVIRELELRLLLAFVPGRRIVSGYW